MHKVLQSIPWRACLLAVQPSSTGPLWGTTSQGIWTIIPAQYHCSYILQKSIKFNHDLQWCCLLYGDHVIQHIFYQLEHEGLPSSKHAFLWHFVQGQNWLFKQNWVTENCRSETCYQIALAMKGWGGESWGWRSKCKISVWPVGSRHHPPLIIEMANYICAF
jgi:hypothetical protein